MEQQYVIAVVVVLVVLVLLVLNNKEKLTQYTVDMAGAVHPDPVRFKYTGRLRDPNGMDGYDYYYNNRAHYLQGNGPRLQGLPAFNPRAEVPHPRITPDAQTRLEQNPGFTMRDGELAWSDARKTLENRYPDKPVTRSQIEAKAAKAEEDALMANLL